MFESLKNSVVSGFNKGKEVVAKHATKKNVAIAAGAIAVAGVGFGVYKYAKSKKQKAAAQAVADQIVEEHKATPEYKEEVAKENANCACEKGAVKND